MNYKPTLDRLVVKVIDVEEKTTGGLYLGPTKDKSLRKGEIVAFGPGKYDNGTLLPMNFSVGQLYLFSSLGGVDIGNGYRIYNSNEALAEELK